MGQRRVQCEHGRPGTARRFQDFVDNYRRFGRGEALQYLVDFERGY